MNTSIGIIKTIVSFHSPVKANLIIVSVYIRQNNILRYLEVNSGKERK